MIKLSVFILFLIVLTSCTKQIEPEPLKLDEISGARLWKRIKYDTDYKKYSYWPKHKGINPGQAPHGTYHEIFISESLFKALPINTKIAPNGTIIVKDNMNVNQEVVKITVMAKVEGYNPEGGDWFWAAFSPKGEVLAEGVPRGCFNCHMGMKSNDYIIVRPLDL